MRLMALAVILAVVLISALSAHASWALLPGIMGAMVVLTGVVAYALVRLMDDDAS
jgi:uncharacterized membrane protein YdcZ (DUF606 family)